MDGHTTGILINRVYSKEHCLFTKSVLHTNQNIY
jgi:hypothetical protein